MRLVPPKGEAAKDRSIPCVRWSGFSFCGRRRDREVKAYEHDERDKRATECRSALAKLATCLRRGRDHKRARPLARGRIECDAASERRDGRESAGARL